MARSQGRIDFNDLRGIEKREFSSNPDSRARSRRGRTFASFELGSRDFVEKLMGLDPSSPEMTFLLVMLHTGTMFAVIAYFWKAWSQHYFSRAERLRDI